MITRMKTTLANTGANLLRHDKEIEKEKKEILKLEEANKKLKEDTDKNTKLGEQLLAEMAAIEEEKKANKEALDQRRNNFNQLKRSLQTIEEEETKAKQYVEDAIKQRNNLDEYCKKIKSRIKENREKFKNLDLEFGFIFREEVQEEEN